MAPPHHGLGHRGKEPGGRQEQGQQAEGFVFGITATDPWTLALSTGFFWAVTFVACWLPARAASRIDPLAAIREE